MRSVRLMLDAHCHLAGTAFVNDLDAVVERARHAGLQTVLCIVAADDADEQQRALQLRSIWPEVRFATGVHPHQAGVCEEGVAAVETRVREAIDANPSVRAVGEIGLDYHYDLAPRTTQQDVFRRQVRLARELALPVVIHMRDAEDDTLSILQEVGGGDVTGVFHCFTGDAATARRALDLGFYLSFSGIVTFPRAESLREVAKLVPAHRILVETDAPYLAPVPHRGGRNEPAWVTHVVDALAAARGATPAAFGAEVCESFSTLIRG